MEAVSEDDNAQIMRVLGRIEGTLNGLVSEMNTTKSDMKENVTALHARLDVHIKSFDEHVAEDRQYRNYIIGFIAAVSLVASGLWDLVTHFGERLFPK
jgi:hypothetical protein